MLGEVEDCSLENFSLQNRRKIFASLHMARWSSNLGRKRWSTSYSTNKPLIWPVKYFYNGSLVVLSNKLRSAQISPIWEWSQVVELHFVTSNIPSNPSSGSHKHSTHFLGEFGDKTRHFLCIISFNWCNVKKKPCPLSPLLKIAHFPCFMILWINLIVPSTLVHENSKTEMEWNAPKTTLS